MRKKYYLFSIVIVVVLAFSLYFYQRQRTNFFNYSVRDMQPRVYYEIDGPIIVGYEKELTQAGAENEFKQVQKLFGSLKESDFTETKETKKGLTYFKLKFGTRNFYFHKAEIAVEEAPSSAGKSTRKTDIIKPRRHSRHYTIKPESQAKLKNLYDYVRTVVLPSEEEEKIRKILIKYRDKKYRDRKGQK